MSMNGCCDSWNDDHKPNCATVQLKELKVELDLYNKALEYKKNPFLALIEEQEKKEKE